MDLRLMILKKFGPQGSVCPHPGAIYMYYSDIQRSSLKPLGQSKPNFMKSILPVCRKSMEPVEKIHGISGQSPWNPWTLSGWSIGTKTLDNFQ